MPIALVGDGAAAPHTTRHHAGDAAARRLPLPPRHSSQEGKGRQASRLSAVSGRGLRAPEARGARPSRVDATAIRYDLRGKDGDRVLARARALASLPGVSPLGGGRHESRSCCPQSPPLAPRCPRSEATAARRGARRSSSLPPRRATAGAATRRTDAAAPTSRRLVDPLHQAQTTTVVEPTATVTIDVAGGNGQVIDYDRYVPGRQPEPALAAARPDGTLTNLTADFPTADFNGADVSFDATQAVFSMKKDANDHYHIYTVAAHARRGRQVRDPPEDGRRLRRHQPDLHPGRHASRS